MEWREFLKQEPNDFNPLWHYLAQIATEIRRSYIRKPTSVRYQDFLLEFEEKTIEAPKTMQQREAHIQKSKSAWAGLFGAFKKNKKQ